MWFFFLLTMYFMTMIWGRQLDLLANGTGYTTLRHQANNLYHLFLSTIFSIKKKVGFIIIDLDICLPSLFKRLDVESFHCNVYEFAKHRQATFLISNKRSSDPFHLILSDIWDSSIVSNIFGAHWFVSFTDDYTRVVWIFFLKNKSYVSLVLLDFHSMIKNQFGTMIKRFRSNNATVFQSSPNPILSTGRNNSWVIVYKHPTTKWSC